MLLLHLNMVVIPVKHRCGRTKALTDVTSPNEQPERTVDRRAAPRRAALRRHYTLTAAVSLHTGGNFLFIHGALSPEVANLEQHT